ncbi:hypothetical protein BH10BDE1_BH10BDE1_10650 [soil metagenome]
MKNVNHKLIAILGATLLMLNIGCASEKNAGVDPSGVAVTDCSRTACTGVGTTPDAPGGSGSGSDGTGGYYSGSTAPLTNVSNLGTMFFNSYPNAPTNIQVNVDMNRTLDAVIVSYTDNGKVVEAGLGTRFPNGSRENNQYNGWVNEGSARVYKGFFQDKYGAVVVIIDKVLNAGDGSASASVGGSIWFQNFGENPAYDSKCQSGDPRYGTCFLNQLMCWEIKAGPYDCRTFIVGSSVITNSATTPNNKGPSRSKSYLKLGDFNGLSRAASNLPSP